MFGVGIFETVLVLCAADAVLDGQVLHRLHVERDAIDLGEHRLQAADDLGMELPLFQRLQVDLMRPLFTVVFVPSTPMNDDKLSTAGLA